MRHLTVLILTVMLLPVSLVSGELSLRHKALATIDLPVPALDSGYSIEKALRERRSVRKYTSDPVTLEEVSQLLWAAYGITYTRDEMPDFIRGGLKTAPSAGARYPLEIYMVAGNVTGLEAGIYWYIPDGHKLIKLASGDIRSDLQESCLGQKFAGEAPASIVWSAVYERCTEKYGDRGRDRYVCMDLGHSAENVYLQCGSLGLGTCAIGAFTDESLKAVMGMTEEEVPLYVMPVGRLTK
ncbi:MAG: SagB/ThcOx family dehydrogenase [Candidatus Krumholzibacteriota bacterium]|nr:SagB/ThcOx family dehydrogenase [Candidatus Krumholzibacteriota bacterium]